MKKTRVKLIVKEFYKQMNPDMWNGSGERPDSFDTHAWEYPLTDAVHLELAFGHDKVTAAGSISVIWCIHLTTVPLT